MNTKLNTMGYSSDDIDVIFDDDYNIKHLKILNTKKDSNDKSVNIKDVNISLDDNRGSDDDNKNGKIKESEKTKLKKYFGDTYKINENEIEIS